MESVKKKGQDVEANQQQGKVLVSVPEVVFEISSRNS